MFHTFYDFFKLPEAEAAAMIGKPFSESNPKLTALQREKIYFPIGLSNRWENYGYATGLIVVSPVWPACPVTRKSDGYPEWFRCGLASPDDGDCDLDFLGDEVKHRPAVLEFMQSMPWEETSIKEVLTMVQDHVRAGSLNGKPYKTPA